VLIDQSLQTQANCLGTVGDSPVGNHGIDLFDESVVEACHKLSHT